MNLSVNFSREQTYIEHYDVTNVAYPPDVNYTLNLRTEMFLQSSLGIIKALGDFNLKIFEKGRS